MASFIPKRNIFNIRGEELYGSDTVSKLLTHFTANYHWQMATLIDELEIEIDETDKYYDPLKRIFYVLLGNATVYENFAKRIRDYYFSKSEDTRSTETMDSICHDMINYCKENDVERGIRNYGDFLWNGFFWRNRTGGVSKVDIPEGPKVPDEVTQMKTYDWKRNPRDSDYEVLNQIMKNKSLCSSFNIIMRSQMSLKKDLTYGKVKQADPGAPGGDPHTWKVVLAAIIQKVDEEARNKDGLLVKPENWFKWVPAQNIPFLKALRGEETREKIIDQLEHLGLEKKLCHAEPSDTPCTDPSHQKIWVRLPLILKEKATAEDRENTLTELVTSLLILGFVGEVENVNKFTGWVAYFTAFFSTTIVAHQIEKETAIPKASIRTILSKLSGNSSYYRQFSWGLGLLLARALQYNSAQKFLETFSTDKKFEEFIGWNVITTTVDINYAVEFRNFQLLEQYVNIVYKEVQEAHLARLKVKT